MTASETASPPTSPSSTASRKAIRCEPWPPVSPPPVSWPSSMPRQLLSCKNGSATRNRISRERHMPDLTSDQRRMLTRWRLVLGASAEQHGISLAGDDEEARRIEVLVGFLFGPAGTSAKG